MPKRILSGIAIKDTVNKTVVISVETQKQHTRYKKRIKTKKRYMAHDESNSIKAGNYVKIEEHIPISKKKKWLVIK